MGVSIWPSLAMNPPFHAGVPVNEITAAMANTAILPIQYLGRTFQRGLSVRIAIGHNHRAPWSSGIHTPESPCLRDRILCILCRPDVDNVVDVDETPVNEILVVPRNPVLRLNRNPVLVTHLPYRLLFLASECLVWAATICSAVIPRPALALRVESSLAAAHFSFSDFLNRPILFLRFVEVIWQPVPSFIARRVYHSLPPSSADMSGSKDCIPDNSGADKPHRRPVENALAHRHCHEDDEGEEWNNNHGTSIQIVSSSSMSIPSSGPAIVFLLFLMSVGEIVIVGVVLA
jgi:hypothetical protein